MNNAIWLKLSRPPLTALKAIQAGRLKGKTDINPQWRMQAMTELFGPCGVGWKYTIDKLWIEQGFGDEVCAFALVSVSTCTDGVWSDPIPGIGGSMLIAQESRGPYTSDEAYKMAVTDALSVAFKALGMAAEIYLGNFDGSKYKTQPPRETAGPASVTKATPATELPPDEFKPATNGDKNAVAKALSALGVTAKPHIINWIQKHGAGINPNNLSSEDCVELCRIADEMVQQSEREAIQAEGGNE